MSRVSPPIRTTVPTAGRAEFHAFREALHDFAASPTIERFRALQRVGRTLDAARAGRGASEGRALAQSPHSISRGTDARRARHVDRLRETDNSPVKGAHDANESTLRTSAGRQRSSSSPSRRRARTATSAPSPDTPPPE